jgi:hypothetical protein
MKIRAEDIQTAVDVMFAYIKNGRGEQKTALSALKFLNETLVQLWDAAAAATVPSPNASSNANIPLPPEPRGAKQSSYMHTPPPGWRELFGSGVSATRQLTPSERKRI